MEMSDDDSTQVILQIMMRRNGGRWAVELGIALGMDDYFNKAGFCTSV